MATSISAPNGVSTSMPDLRNAVPHKFFGFYRGVAPGVTGSLATGATYFGVIESTKKWIEEKNPNLGGHWSHFIAGAADTGLHLQEMFLLLVSWYNGWSDALRKTWMTEGLNGLFKGSIPRVIWYIPASALTFMAVEFLREHFNEKTDDDVHEITSLSLDTSSKIQEAV
ncbi:hypothetical protein J5N97_015986 [Dioscorea zingiberensis]|uniref:Mitochondrial 18 kDa protein n=1 Tax=Dioscorea zingiberensis TaxID=325984 RepID=A0A9D5CIT7_9LILI|nr:hypothetical protein J5N97_015986 [Dioscorea zingiberensis]